MVLEFLQRKPKGGATALAEKEKSPVLTDADQKFFQELTGEQAPPLPDRPVTMIDTLNNPPQGKDAQIALMDGADRVALPTSPPESAPTSPPVESKETSSRPGKERRMSSYLSYVKNIPNVVVSKAKGKQKEHAGSDLQTAIDAAKKGETVESDPAAADQAEREKEQKEITSVLDQLNLSAVNNRAFSFSEKSQEMMAEFTQILKDLVNGVPTAYDDLEKFLKNWDEYLKKMYDDLPDFLKNLVKSLPAKVSSTVAPALAAAASEKPGADASAAGIETASSGASKFKIPSLKKLVASQSAITGMLRSILNFLKLRFPAAVTGTNVLLSLAVFLLLFVFWYCHKRGKETRLEKERLAAEGTAADDSDFEPTPSEMGDSAMIKKADDDEAMQKVLNQPAPSSVALPPTSPSEGKK